jgi:adenylyltransferase/sulfurtransferase
VSPVEPRKDVREARVLLAGAGGLGCSAAWGLVEAGVGRLTVVDPDGVEESNLPRQVLFRETDLGEPKAPAAARALRGRGTDVRGERARLDDTTAARLLAEADVVVDATDGALAKDWIHREAVRRGIPIVHAAAVGSEGRLMEVGPGGRPCLACLFGRLEQEAGSCADLGVWSGMVGAVGFLAAEAAVRRLEAPDAPSPGYWVLDAGAGRSFLASVRPDER